MRTAIEIPRRTRRRSHAFRHPVRLLLTAIVLVMLAKSAVARVPATMPGAPECRDLPGATTVQYETGTACPPDGFATIIGYTPVLVQTRAGWRYTRPISADGGCSDPLADEGPFWDFGDVCRAHDYGYDLVRFGIGERTEADALLYRDMKRSCAANGPVGAPACKALADSAHAVLWAGDVSPGFEPGPDDLP